LKSKKDFQISTKEQGRRKTQKSRTKTKNNKTSSKNKSENLSSSVSIKHELTSRQFACPLCKGTMSKYKHKREGGAFKVILQL
jgi:hypothetical protein